MVWLTILSLITIMCVVYIIYGKKKNRAKPYIWGVFSLFFILLVFWYGFNTSLTFYEDSRVISKNKIKVYYLKDKVMIHYINNNKHMFKSFVKMRYYEDIDNSTEFYILKDHDYYGIPRDSTIHLKLD